MKAEITVLVSESPRTIEGGTTIFKLRDTVKPGANVLICNGIPIVEDQPLCDGDAVVFIVKGEIPSQEELEALMAARHTPGVHRILRQSAVAIAGLGGLGSSVAVALARTGVGMLVLADFDVVEPSNLNRQQYFVDQIGRLKTDALAETLTQVNPAVAVRTHAVRLTPENIPELFRETQVVVEAFDQEEEKAMLVETVLKVFPNTVVVAASGMAGHGSANLVQTTRVSGRLYLCGDGSSACVPGCGLMAPRVGIASHHQANMVLRLLLGERDA